MEARCKYCRKLYDRIRNKSHCGSKECIEANKQAALLYQREWQRSNKKAKIAYCRHCGGPVSSPPTGRTKLWCDRPECEKKEKARVKLRQATADKKKKQGVEVTAKDEPVNNYWCGNCGAKLTGYNRFNCLFCRKYLSSKYAIET